MLTRESARRIARLGRRARAIAFLDGAADATVVAGLAAGSALLLLRLLGWPAPAAVVWTLGLAVVAAAAGWGLRTMLRRTPRPEGCAAWLDRRLKLGGLLVTSAEVDAAAWQQPLQRALAFAEESLPPLPVRRAAPRVLLPLAFVAAIVLLPAAKPEPPAVNPAIADALAVEQARLDLLEEREALEPEVAEELQAKLDELEQRLQEREPVGWSDVDTLAARGEAELALRIDALEHANEALGAVSAAGGTELAGRLGEVLRELQEAGLLRDLPQELLDRLEALGAEGGEGLDPGALAGLDPEALQALARDLQGAYAGKLNRLVEAGLADPLKGRQLAELSAAEWRAAPPQHEHDKHCTGGACSGGLGGMMAGAAAGAGSSPGRGGITRGRGDAALTYSGDTPEADRDFAAQQLPSTAPLSLEWSTTAIGLAEPQADPVESQSAGSAGEEGAGAAAWQRRLAPHHRDVVKRFFERRP